MKEIYMELLNKFDGQIPEDFNLDEYLKQKANEREIIIFTLIT